MTVARKHGKRYADNLAKVDREREYAPAEAVALIKSFTTGTLNETVEVHIRTGLNVRHADEQLRGTIALPHGLGREMTVAVFAKGDKAREAEEACADHIGEEDLATKVEEGFTDFDVAIATPDMMPVVGKLGRVLGPQGKMPNPKVGTVTNDVGKAVSEAKAGRAARAGVELGFERATGDWRTMLDDPEIDVVDICTPNHLHFEMARAALAAGKHVYCEKPLTLTVAEAETLAGAARAAGVVHGVGLNYTANPLIRTARDIVAAGEIGEVLHFSGRYFEDYMASADVPFTWRCERRLAGAGALADLGSHLINMLHYVVGPPTRLAADVHTAIVSRRDASGAQRTVENEDYARAFLELASGAPATLEISRIATGRKCGLAFDVFGTRGGFSFDQERMNELRLYDAGQAPGRAGYKTILAGPEHGDYARFCPAPGHGLGINDLKVIEMHDFIRALQRGVPFYPDFDEGLRVQRVMQAIEDAAAGRCWIALDFRAGAT